MHRSRKNENVETTSNTCLIEQMLCPGVGDPEKFETVPEAALLLFHETAGLDHFNHIIPTCEEEPRLSVNETWLQNYSVPESVLPLWNEIGTGITNEIKKYLYQCVSI